MLDLRTEMGRTMRKGYRSARRVAVGAQELSPRVTASWLVARARRHGRPAENSSFTWVVATEDETTVLWLHNYWSDAYGIAQPRLTASLLDPAGVPQAVWAFDLPADATMRIDIRQECRSRGVGVPFEGQLLLVLRDERVVPGRPVQLLAEYVGDGGECSAVHGQYGLMDSPLAQRIGGVPVDPDLDARSGLVLVNAYGGPGAPTPQRPRLEVLSADGAVRSAELAPIPAQGMSRVFLDEVIDDLHTFLAGRPGQMRVAVGCPSSRVLTFVEHVDDGRRVVNHATIDRAFDQAFGTPAGWTGPPPVASIPVLCHEGRDTVLVLPNSWGPKRSAEAVEVQVFAADGSTIASTRIHVPALATRELSMRDLLQDADQPLPFVGHAEVRLGQSGAPREMPAQLDVVVSLRDGGDNVAEVQVGGEFFNAEVPPGVVLPDIRRTRVFTRVRAASPDRTSIFLAYPAPPGLVAEPARPCLTLIDPSGTRRTQVELSVPVHGCVLGEVTDLFPDWREVLGPEGYGAVRVRDTGARLYGFHLVERAGARNVTFDHLVGG
jgi:hypothetical protein